MLKNISSYLLGVDIRYFSFFCFIIHPLIFFCYFINLVSDITIVNMSPQNYLLQRIPLRMRNEKLWMGKNIYRIFTKYLPYFKIFTISPHISDSIWYLSFSFWLTSLSMIMASYIHVAANGIISFFLWLSNISIVYMYHTFFIHSSADRHLG